MNAFLKMLLATWSVGIEKAIGKVSGVISLTIISLTLLQVKGISLSFFQAGILFFGLVLLVLLAGFVYIRLGLFKAENQRIFSEKPQLVEILEIVKELKERK